MRLLHLEDDEFDIEFTNLLCAGRWTECEIVPARNRKAYVAALVGGKFDGIISDSGVAGLPGTDALQLAREHAPGIPFMFLCGAMSDERREELMAAKPDGIAAKDNPCEVEATMERVFWK